MISNKKSSLRKLSDNHEEPTKLNECKKQIKLIASLGFMNTSILINKDNKKLLRSLLKEYKEYTCYVQEYTRNDGNILFELEW